MIRTSSNNEVTNSEISSLYQSCEVPCSTREFRCSIVLVFLLQISARFNPTCFELGVVVTNEKKEKTGDTENDVSEREEETTNVEAVSFITMDGGEEGEKSILLPL